MKVIHIESGLGNQMLAYAEYLAIKKMNSNEECYIETIIYEIPEASNVIAQWNGYELEKIFNIKIPNVKELFTNKQWNSIINNVKASRFWENDWAYPKAICKALNEELDIELINKCTSLDGVFKTSYISDFKNYLLSFPLGYSIRTKLKNINKKKYIEMYSQPEKLFFTDSNNLYCGFTLLFQYRNNNIEIIEQELRQSFVFPQFTEKRDFLINQKILTTSSVAIHIRRGDRTSSTNKYYSGGYFKKAVNFIKKKVENPYFYIFSDPDSCKWAIENYKLLGLNENDNVDFVDWHNGEDSYRDMQLISNCKHAIITVSSFSWWGAYLINNNGKIVISPEVEINTNTHV